MLELAIRLGNWHHVSWALVEEKEEREKGELHQFIWSPLITF